MKTIRRYTDPTRAHFDQSLLEGHGVSVFLKNENMGSMAPIFSAANGGIELQVDEEDVEKALQVLGPESNNPEKVNELSSELNRLFGFSVLCGLLSAFLHSASQGFSLEAVDRTVTAGIAGFFVAVVAISSLKRLLGKSRE
ncbi:MAG: DUF2007 domain-containing protein [Opitutales bacterium]|nr:DUF2007 domain-containing protein [Opitutales bacterium]